MKYDPRRPGIGHVIEDIDPKQFRFELFETLGTNSGHVDDARRDAKELFPGEFFLINTAFFHPRREGGGNRIYGDILALSKSKSWQKIFRAWPQPNDLRGYNRHVFAISEFGYPTIFLRSEIHFWGNDAENEIRRQYPLFLGGLGLLVSRGKREAKQDFEARLRRSANVKDPRPGEECPQFQSDVVGDTPSPRPAIGIKEDGKLIVVVSNSMTAHSLHEKMCDLGVWDAVFLDGGGSTSLADSNKVIVSGGRDRDIPCWLAFGPK